MGRQRHLHQGRLPEGVGLSGVPHRAGTVPLGRSMGVIATFNRSPRGSLTRGPRAGGWRRWVVNVHSIVTATITRTPKTRSRPGSCGFGVHPSPGAGGSWIPGCRGASTRGSGWGSCRRVRSAWAADTAPARCCTSLGGVLLAVRRPPGPRVAGIASRKDLVVSLQTVWGAANCLTARRSRALSLFQAALRSPRRARRLPGSYSWRELRREGGGALRRRRTRRSRDRRAAPQGTEPPRPRPSPVGADDAQVVPRRTVARRRRRRWGRTAPADYPGRTRTTVGAARSRTASIWAFPPLQGVSRPPGSRSCRSAPPRPRRGRPPERRARRRLVSTVATPATLPSSRPPPTSHAGGPPVRGAPSAGRR